MNLVHLPRRLAEAYWGGTESVLAALCRGLGKRGHRQKIFTTRALESTPRSFLEGVEVRRFPYFYPYLGLRPEARAQLDRRGGNLFSWHLGWHLWKERQLDLIHLHTGKRLGGIGRWVARRRAIPYVVSLHGGVYDVPAEEQAGLLAPTRGSWEWGRLLGWMVGSRRLLDDADLVLCLGREEQRRLQIAHPSTRIECFPNGVEFDLFRRGQRSDWRQRLGLGEQDRLLLCVGRLDPQKNQALALRLLAQLPPHHHLLLLGAVTDESYFRQLQELIVELGLQSRVHGLCAASGQALIDAYHASDLFLLPSVHEPFGIVVLEAWAAGLPVVASAVGGLLDLIEDGQNGFLFASQDVNQARVAVEQALQQPELGARGQQHCQQNYDWASLCRRLEGFYEEVIRAHSRGQ